MKVVIDLNKSKKKSVTLFQYCPWIGQICHGLINLLEEKPEESVKNFIASLDQIKNIANGSASPQKAIAQNFSFMGLAAYEAKSKMVAVRYWRM